MTIVAATHEAIERAAQALARGEIVAFPTETVYGLGANALNASAVAKIFAAKARPRFNPLIVHVPGPDEAGRYAVIGDTARTLMQAFWPGPLSLVLPRRAGSAIAVLTSAGLGTIALRAPSHPVARALLEAAKLPIAAPSANRSGRISPTTAAHVEAELGDLPSMTLDGGPCSLGLESTVLGIEGDGVTLLRAWRLAEGGDRGGAGAGWLHPRREHGPISRRGSWRAHYAPGTPLRLDAIDAREGEALLAFGPDAPRLCGTDDQSQPARRSRRGGGQFLRRTCAARCGRAHRHRRHADPEPMGSARPSTTVCDAPLPQRAAARRRACTPHDARPRAIRPCRARTR